MLNSAYDEANKNHNDSNKYQQLETAFSNCTAKAQEFAYVLNSWNTAKTKVLAGAREAPPRESVNKTNVDKSPTLKIPRLLTNVRIPPK